MKEKMTDPEVARIRARHQEGLRKGMTNAEASAYANEGLTPSPKDEVTRTRQRFYNAQRRGMSIAEATAYANNRDVAEPSVGAGAQVELADAPSSAESSANPQSHLVGDSGPVEKAASPPLQPTLSACTDHAGLVHYPDREVLQALLAHNFNAFGEFAFSAVRPGVPLKRNWHLEAMAEKLAQVTSGKIRRLLITLPPRHLKSLYASVALPAWFLGHNPWERVVVASYSDLLARNHASDFRRLVNDPLYQATFPGMRLARDTDREITTTERGKRIATSIAGTLTGLGGNLFIIDDPLKAGDAMSESVRAQVIEWYRSTLLSRGDDKTAMRIVVVMQRVHQNDLVGYLLEQGGFEVLNLPAIAQRDETFDLGGGRTYWRQKGELLHPEHEPADALIELKRNMGPFAFSAQYQQSPIPPGGTIIKRKWLKTYDNIQYQAGDQIIMSWDIALNVAIDGNVCGLGRTRHREFAMGSGEMSEAEFATFLQAVFGRLAEHTVDGSIHQVCMDWRHMWEMLAAGRAVYSELKNLCVWNKANAGMGSFYRSKHELIFVWKNGGTGHINNFELGQHGRNRTNVWDYAGVNSLRAGRLEELAMHPTVKPVALVADAIKDCSDRGSLVLDPFCGSGTSLIAAERTGRKARSLEIDPAYVDVAVRRWQTYTGKAAILAASGETFETIEEQRAAKVA